MTQKLHIGRQGRGKRQAIIETTVDLFRKTHDIRKVSLEDIAVEARVSPTTIYNQFGTRDALVTEAARTLLSEIGSMVEHVMKSDLPFDQKLTGILTGKIALSSAAGDEVIAKMLSQDKNIAPFIEKTFKEVAFPLWRDFLTQGKREGFVKPDVDEEAFIEYFDAVRIGLTAKKDLMQNWTQNLGLLEKITRIMFYGFLRKEIDLFSGDKNDHRGENKE